MASRASRIYLIVFVVLVLCIGVGLGLWAYHKPAAAKEYIGSKAVLSIPSHSASFQIDDAVLSIPSLSPKGVLADIRTTAFTGTAAEGLVTYSKVHVPVNFMAVKNNNKWIVIAHNTGKKLILPNSTTAKKYHLPRGWYSSNTN